MSKNTLRVLHVSDTHLHAFPTGKLCGVNTHDALQEVLAEIKAWRWRPDFILVTGDFSQDRTKVSYDRWRLIFEDLNLPIYCLPGNHDDPVMMADIFQKGKIQYLKHFIQGNWHFIMLSSFVPNSNAGHLSAEELGFLKRTLKENFNLHAVIALHHNPIPMGSQWLDQMTVANGNELMELIRQFPHVRVVAWGHVHQEFEGRDGDVRLFSAPSTCIQFKPKTDQFALDDKAPGFRWYEFHEDGSIDSGVQRVKNSALKPDLGAKGY